jgi:hypothetical protein
VIVPATTLDSVPLGRRRLLAGASAALAALGARLWFPERAAAAPPNGCFGYNACSCCSGTRCCRSGCRGGYYGCPSGGQCWNTCAYDGSQLYRFRCCDWAYGTSGRCICRGRLGLC